MARTAGAVFANGAAVLLDSVRAICREIVGVQA